MNVIVPSAAMSNLPLSVPPVIAQVVLSSAVSFATAVWFSLTVIADSVAPAVPLGPVIFGAVSSRLATVTMIFWVVLLPLVRCANRQGPARPRFAPCCGCLPRFGVQFRPSTE
ncbi:hypothetical protein [Novosphingobium sp. TH158]|uniref:hypothetical protein n=1 Tax=Novosphingobium sp. TH158 TaxID=2067455 RepID=UPI001181B745|nr:hypothetical protein [Novosphingobium sp. TH158]